MALAQMMWTRPAHEKGPVTRKMFPYDDVIMEYSVSASYVTFAY